MLCQGKIKSVNVQKDEIILGLPEDREKTTEELHRIRWDVNDGNDGMGKNSDFTFDVRMTVS